MIQEAGVVNLIKTIIIIIAVYYALKLISRYLFPYLLKRFINKQQEKFYGNQAGQPFSKQDQNHHKEGDVEIKANPNHHQKNKDIGEYVDFEEVSDDK